MTNCPNCGASMRLGYAHVCEVINHYPDALLIENISNGELLLLLRNYLNDVKLLEEKYGMSVTQLQNFRYFL